MQMTDENMIDLGKFDTILFALKLRAFSTVDHDVFVLNLYQLGSMVPVMSE